MSFWLNLLLIFVKMTSFLCHFDVIQRLLLHSDIILTSFPEQMIRPINYFEMHNEQKEQLFSFFSIDPWKINNLPHSRALRGLSISVERIEPHFPYLDKMELAKPWWVAWQQSPLASVSIEYYAPFFGYQLIILQFFAQNRFAAGLNCLSQKNPLRRPWKSRRRHCYQSHCILTEKCETLGQIDSFAKFDSHWNWLCSKSFHDLVVHNSHILLQGHWDRIFRNEIAGQISHN